MRLFSLLVETTYCLSGTVRLFSKKNKLSKNPFSFKKVVGLQKKFANLMGPFLGFSALRFFQKKMNDKNQ